MGTAARITWATLAAAGGLLGQINPPSNVSLVARATRPGVDAYFGIWGHSAPDGREFAVVGCNTGILVRRVDPASSAEWFFDDTGAPGSGNPFYRDVAVYGSRVYSIGYTHSGIRVIDLAPLNGPVDLGWILPGLWLNAHTIQVDPELGYLFVNGATKPGTADRPLMVVDVGSPAAPRLVVEYSGKQNVVGPPPSAVQVMFDTYARRGRVYTSEHRPGGGLFRIMEPGNHANLNTTLPIAELPQLTGETHSCWVSEDDDLFVGLHEGIGAPVSGHIVFWDIGGLRLQPPVAPSLYLTSGGALATYGTPWHTVHNAHGIGRSLYVAHFTDGFHLVGVADPSNAVRVAYYDTTAVAPGSQLGPPIGQVGARIPSSYYGAWDVYPYLDSGLVLVSDLLNGLHVLRVEKGHFNRYGAGVAGPGGTVPRMTAGGDVPRSGARFSIELEGLAAGQAYWALFSLAEDPARPVQPILGIPVYIDLGAAYLGFVGGTADAAGKGRIALPIPDPTPLPWVYVQVVQLDPATLRASTSRGTWFGIAR